MDLFSKIGIIEMLHWFGFVDVVDFIYTNEYGYLFKEVTADRGESVIKFEVITGKYENILSNARETINKYERLQAKLEDEVLSKEKMDELVDERLRRKQFEVSLKISDARGVFDEYEHMGDIIQHLWNHYKNFMGLPEEEMAFKVILEKSKQQTSINPRTDKTLFDANPEMQTHIANTNQNLLKQAELGDKFQRGKSFDERNLRRYKIIHDAMMENDLKQNKRPKIDVVRSLVKKNGNDFIFADYKEGAAKTDTLYKNYLAFVNGKNELEINNLFKTIDVVK